MASENGNGNVVRWQWLGPAVLAVNFMLIGVVWNQSGAADEAVNSQQSIKIEALEKERTETRDRLKSIEKDVGYTRNEMDKARVASERAVSVAQETRAELLDIRRLLEGRPALRELPPDQRKAKP